jgi:hypothetical protein
MNIDDQLRHHDPARGVPEDLGRMPRAMATLARVTATEPGSEPAAVSIRPARRKRVARYALAALVTSAGVVLAPILGTGDAAVANWDAQPRPATAQEAAQYAQECATWTNVSLDETPNGYEPKVVEVRGTWVMTYLASADGEAQCLRSTKPDFADGENESQFGPLTQTPAADALATAGVLETSGGITNTQFIVAGKAGSQVTDVVFETQGMQVQATVKNGIFTAWWPQREPASLFGRLVDDSGFNGSPNPEVRITLSNGRTITKHVKDYDVNH